MTRTVIRAHRRGHAPRVGISGWRYRPWRGLFYPQGLPHAEELAYASRRFETIELNGSFYGLLRPDHYRSFAEATPPDFCFAVKGSRYITHMKRLRDAKAPLANFFASGVLALREKLGPFLWQLPPNMTFDPERLETFLALLPRSTAEAEALARRHDARVKGRAFLRAGVLRPLRHALEVRHPSFFVPELISILRRHAMAFVFSDSPGTWPYAENVTSDFVYLRLHGSAALYSSAYTPGELTSWASRIRAWGRGDEPRDAKRVPGTKPARPRASRDVYVYFDNDVKAFAPSDAEALIHLLRSPETST